MEQIVGGVFLQEEKGLVLRALRGSVEELINFIDSIELSLLLCVAKAHRSRDEPLTWISAPILCCGKAKGAVVIACKDGNGSCLSFLERAASRIGRLLEADRITSPILPESIMPKIQTSPAQEKIL